MATPRVMAWVTGSFYLAGGVAGVAIGAGGVTPALPANATALLALGIVATVSSVVLLRWGRHLPSRAFHGVVALATVLIATAVGCCDNPVSAVALCGLYLFVVVDAVFFFAWPAAVLHALLVAVLAGWGLARFELPWGLQGVLLSVTVAVAVLVRRLVRLASEVTVDALTGLTNRRGFEEAAGTAVAVAHRTRSRLTLTLFDLDDFKEVNDTGGHAAGDEVLRVVGRHLAEHLPRGGVAARLGGDEFVVLAPGVSAAETRAVVEDRRRWVGIRYSVGIAELLPGESLGELLRRADTALYAAKSAGRNRSCVWERPSPRERRAGGGDAA